MHTIDLFDTPVDALAIRGSPRTTQSAHQITAPGQLAHRIVRIHRHGLTPRHGPTVHIVVIAAAQASRFASDLADTAANQISL